MDATPSSHLVPGAVLAAEVTAGVDPNSVRSVDRAASLLLALGDWDGKVGVTELARRLGLHKSRRRRAC